MQNNHNETNTAFKKETPLKLSRDPKKAVHEMIGTIDDLERLYEMENQALEKFDTKTFASLQNHKIHYAQRYQAGALQLIERREEFASISAVLKAKLTEKQARFSTIAAQNMGALERVRKATKRLNDRVMNMAKEAFQREQVNYTKSGDLNRNIRPVSIGLNESA